MKKRVFIIHAWGFSPEDNWYPWLKKELESNNFEIIVPSMPNTEYPKIENWVPYLSKIADKPDKNTYFVGHSVGCQTIVRYLEKLPKNLKVGGAIFVAGFFSSGKKTLMGLTEKEKEIIKPWLSLNIDFAKVRKHLPKSVAIFSDNDPYVRLKEKDAFEKEFGSKTIIMKNKGHFTDADGINELPIVLEELLKIIPKSSDPVSE